MSQIKVNKSEYLLGQMIAETKRRGLKSCRRNAFQDHNGKSLPIDDENIVACCALGSYALITNYFPDSSIVQAQMFFGNDHPEWAGEEWAGGSLLVDHDNYEALGWAYYQACED